jgi:DNA/RNA endonuclease YhcR with UshA esterase domain
MTMTETKPALPGHETQSSEMNCPSCGRFVGAITKCPYCGTKVEKRMSLVAIRWAAVLLSTIGLFLLFLMAKHREVPVVMLGNIQPTMNFGQIRVMGEVASDARPFRSGMGMSFNVSDGTGKIIVFVSKKQMDDMIARNLVPKAGDQVNFVGGLNISDEESSLRLLSVKEFQLTRAAAASVRLADINNSLVGSAISIAGKVLELTPPPADSKRPYALKLADDSGEQIINFWQTEYDQLQNPDALPGAYIRARVSIAAYQDKLQLKLASGADLEILDGPPAATEKRKSAAEKAAAAYHKQAPAPQRDFSRGRLTDPLPVASVTAAMEGQTVKVRGQVASVRSPEAGSKQPFSLVLQEGAASIRVTYWSNADAVIAVKPTPGATFEVEGVVDVYQDKPQLKVESGYKIIAVESAPPPAAAVAIGSLTAADKGQIRTVQGSLGAPRDLGKGTAYTLVDDSGSLDLILWHSTVPAGVREALAEGLQVTATGEVGEYDGKLQLKAGPRDSIRVLNP